MIAVGGWEQRQGDGEGGAGQGAGGCDAKVAAVGVDEFQGDSEA
jgi:hypothetical protein